ncbi:hypothetical protein PENTCL1PPCAC_12865 [Pristionchus entomophagus]|uniref:G protein-coupled receptor n=1 Tax=Pristionchus entomophagus TaxID=358040 RepID=A0AAV5TDV0_9BILA|nr:hypothetical protein PENTCL1PPCAC_12865 [Pristionchus entomophagus]
MIGGLAQNPIVFRILGWSHWRAIFTSFLKSATLTIRLKYFRATFTPPTIPSHTRPETPRPTSSPHMIAPISYCQRGSLFFMISAESIQSCSIH